MHADSHRLPFRPCQTYVEGVMDYAVEQKQAGWRSLLATVLWLAAAAGGLSLIVPLDPILFGLGLATTADGPTAAVMNKYRIISVTNFGMVIFGVLWLAGIFWMHSWFQRARTTGQLWKRFAIVAGGEALVWGLGYTVERLIFA